MELLGVVFAVIVWTPILLLWLLISSGKRTSKVTRHSGIIILLLLPAFGAFSLGHYMFIDEPLYMAASEGDVAGVKKYLMLGADPNIQFEGHPAIVDAAEGGHTEVVRILIMRGADLNVRNDWNGHTALTVAEEKGHTEIIKLLHQAGVKNQVKEPGVLDELDGPSKN